MKRDLEKLKDALWCMHGLLFGLLLVATLHLSKIEKRLNDLLRQNRRECPSQPLCPVWQTAPDGTPLRDPGVYLPQLIAPARGGTNDVPVPVGGYINPEIAVMWRVNEPDLSRYGVEEAQ